MRQLEICAGSYESALAALRGGADRIELCSGLEEGGLTPSFGLIKAVVKLEGICKHVLIRPRGGDFLCTEAEQSIIVEDIIAAREVGVDGVVIGALTADGEIDVKACRRFVEAARDVNITFHRAFDLCRDPFSALEKLVDLGCTRILTSGQAATAEKGIGVLRKLVKQAAGRIEIMPGSGVSPSNVAKILNETGANEIHASARSVVESRMLYRHEGVGMGRKDANEYARRETSKKEVEILRQEILQENEKIFGKVWKF